MATKNQATASNGMCGWFDTAIKDEQPVPKMQRNDPQRSPVPITSCTGVHRLVGQYEPSSGCALQTRSSSRKCWVGIDQDLSLQPTTSTRTAQPSTCSLRRRHPNLDNDAEKWLAALPRSGPLITFVVVATGSAIHGINCPKSRHPSG